jgi:hypothetical protein
MTDTVPAWLATMRQITGTHALNDNPVILGWAKQIGTLYPDLATYCAGYTHDTIAWCGLTVGYCMAVNGIKPVFGAKDTDRFLYALAWQQFGTAAATPQAGDLLVFDFGGGDHHVTLFEQAQGDSYICRGGNQSDQVKVSSYPKSLCLAVRRPPAATGNVQAVVQAPTVQLFTGITATVFGGAADRNTSAYDGHLIDDNELGVALPARFPDPRPQVRVLNGDKSVICNIVDIGPWNTNDPYWQTGARPEAESGIDQRGRKTNNAGIDLTPGTARALGIDGKGTVSWEFVNMPVSASVSNQVAVPTGDTTLGDLAKWLGQVVTAIGTANGAVVPSNQSAQQIPIFGGIGNMPTPTPANLDPVLQQALAILQALGPQLTQLQTSAGPASPQDLLVKMIGILNAATSPTPGAGVPTLPSGTTPTLPSGVLTPLPLGPVNGALGPAIGNLLNGSKSAIGILGALGFQLLQAGSGVGAAGAASAAPGTILSLLGGTVAPYATPILIALAAWGFLGKMEKWAQATTAAAQSTATQTTTQK